MTTKWRGFWAVAVLTCACNEAPTTRSNEGVPCDVAKIVAEHCAECHGSTPAFGAPMSLVSQADFQAAARDGTSSVYDVASARLHDATKPMPPIGQPVLSSAELALLDGWLSAGAARADDSCSLPKQTQSAAQTIDLSECEELIELRAHQNEAETDSDPYQVPLDSDHYQCFYFAVPWTDDLQALRVDPLIDDTRVLHHWLLYEEPVEEGGPGTMSPCNGTHPNASLVAGWAPGGDPYTMPEGVGLRMPKGPERVFTLEIHYNNSGQYVDARDRSGARICATRTLRENEAAAHWLGTDLIVLPPGQGTAASTCRPQQTAHILSVSPHMHKLGRHMSTIITRADGTQETLVDTPFSFDDQRIYSVTGGLVDVGPGDSLRTTCTYDNNTGNLVTFGSYTSQEMCYDFVVAYPVGSLDTGGSFLGGANKCMQ